MPKTPKRRGRVIFSLEGLQAPAEGDGGNELWSLRLGECRSADTRPCPSDQQFTLASIAREPGCALELCARLVHAAELLEEIAADARQEVVVFERRLGSERVDEFEACSRTKSHGKRHRTVQFHNR